MLPGSLPRVQVLELKPSDLNFYDALRFGNVSRFFNHACGDSGNLCVQPIFTERDNTEQNYRYCSELIGSCFFSCN